MGKFAASGWGILAKASILIASAAVLYSCESKASESITQADVDMGTMPWVLDIEKATVANEDYRITKWTGNHLQMVLMSLKPGEVIDLEIHKATDQFIRIEQGQAHVLMGKTADNLSYNQKVSDDWAIFVPAGYYHQIKNIGKKELKVYTIYAPAEHPKGVLNKTYQEAREYHEKHHQHLEEEE